LNHPDEDDWDGKGGTIAEIRRLMDVEAPVARTVRRTLTAICAAEEEGEPYDPWARERGGGARRKVDDAEALAVAHWLRDGYGHRGTQLELNVLRAEEGKAAVSKKAISTAVSRVDSRQRNRRRQKCGTYDEESTWARASLAQCLPLELQMGPHIHAWRRWSGSDLPAIPLDSIFHLDEHHRKCNLGAITKLEVQIPLGPDGEYLALEDGGKFPEWKNKTVPKFVQECRGMFGVMRKQLADGSHEGRRCKPFNYSQKLVVGCKAFEKLIKAEVQRVNALDGDRGVWAAYRRGWKGLPGGKYQLKFGADWRAKATRVVGSKAGGAICVTELIDHAIAEGNRLFADTEYRDSWFLWHDALSQWWEKDAQEHLRSRGFFDRQVRAWGDTSLGTRYYQGLVGNRCELSPLDSHCFQDFIAATPKHVVFTAKYPVNDPRRFKVGTPAELWLVHHGAPLGYLAFQRAHCGRYFSASGCHFENHRGARRGRAGTR
jgi:hypothetical protein